VDETTTEGIQLRIYVGESDHADHRPLWEDILLRAREAGLSGATVMRGVAGFGRDSRIHTTKILRLSQDLPMLIEIVDRADKIEAFRPTIESLVRGGLVTAERVEIWLYRGSGSASADE
jgi:PII-like signaling protein